MVLAFVPSFWHVADATHYAFSALHTTALTVLVLVVLVPVALVVALTRGIHGRALRCYCG